MALLDNGFEALVTIGCDASGNGGTALPDPSQYDANTATLVDSARNVSGIMIGQIIRDDIAKVNLKWKYLTTQQWATVCSLFTGSFSNNVKFFNQTIGAYEVREMYVSDRSAGIYLRKSNGDVQGFTNCSLNLIEV